MCVLKRNNATTKMKKKFFTLIYTLAREVFDIH